MASQWKNVFDIVYKQKRIRENPWANLSPNTSMRYPHSICSKSLSESISSLSSCRASSEESLDNSATSFEIPQTIDRRPQDRLRRIRELLQCGQLKKMELDEESTFTRDIDHSMELATESSESSCYSPMTIDNDDDYIMESVYSASLRMKRFRQAKAQQIQCKVNNSKNKLARFCPWERELSMSNKHHTHLNEQFESLPTIFCEIPRWMIPALTMKPLRRPQL